MPPTATLTVGPSPRRIFGSITIATVAVTAALVALVVVLELLEAVGLLGLLALPPWLWSSRWAIVAWVAALFACYRGVALLGAVYWVRPRVEIGPDGFTDYGVLGHRSRRWTDIQEGFTVVRVGWPVGLIPQPVVAYRLTDTFKETTRITPLPSLAGNDEAILICGELTIGAEELADILNRCKQ